ncbi:hypothetical protein [Halostella litorea]|uniref:hypothetical protein n=1 Tax=Halostella litorea TaxID=2528831 RepID=UPI00109266C4|nr:hypothetical protein [Halostella litorea]
MSAEATPTDAQADSRTPANETVRLIVGITRVMHTPAIVEGETSSTGKTLTASPESEDTTHRIDTAAILAGETEIRGFRTYKLYTPERYQSAQRANHAPGPQAGANGVTDAADLPEPTHTPTDTEGQR